MSEWKEVSLKEITKLVIDYRGKTPLKLGGEWSDSGYRALSAKNVKTGIIVAEESIRYVDEDLYRKWMKDEVQRGDILITSEAPFGEVFFWNSDEKIVLSQRLFDVRIKDDVCAQYVYYYMTSYPFQAELRSRASGTTVLGLKQPELLKAKVTLPDYDTQLRIAAQLSEIDDKIAVNRRICENLEAQAQALFKHWFIDFAPFKNGKFVESELGMIPEGWRVGTLGEICKTNKRTLSSKNTPDVIEYLDTGNITANRIDNIQILQKGQDKIPSRAKRLVSEGDIIFSAVRPNQRHYGLLMNPSPSLVVSTGFVVITANWSAYRYFIYRFLVQNSIIETLQAIGEQSVSTYPSINANDIESLKLIIPKMEDVEDFADICCNFYCKIESIEQESSRLSTLRDTLLPKLMSGQIKVNEMEKSL